MNLLLFSEYFPAGEDSEITGGVEARAFNLIKQLSKKNKVTLITSWRPNLKRSEIVCGAEIVRVGPEHRYTSRGGFFSRFLFVFHAIKEGIKHKETDLVSGENFTTYIPAFLVAKKLKRPCAITYHETWIGEWIKNKGLISGLPFDLYERLLLKLRYDRILSVSNFTRNRLIERGFEKKNIEVIYNGINLEDFDLRVKKVKKKTICFIGRLVKTKRADVLIKAVYILKKTFPNIRCLVVGKGEEKRRLERLSYSLGLEDTVSFCGFIKDSKVVKRILISSTIFCLPSVVEGFGIVIAESMASGTPYVCSDIAVLKEITENGKGGLLFKSDDEKDLAEKLSTLLNGKKNLIKKSAEGKSFVKKYQWKNISQQVEKTYKGVIKEYDLKKVKK